MKKLINKEDYPELKDYSDKQIYENFIGSGGLYLATKMIRKLNIKKDSLILDLGCGMGSSSIFIAERFDVQILSIDLWNSPNFLLEKSRKLNCSHKIIPMQLDITKNITFPDNYFDIIFCMNSLFLFGENLEFLKNLSNILKPSGIICIGSEGFNKEPNFNKIPDVYNFKWHWNVWDVCYSKSHSPDWWASHLLTSGGFDIKYCEELTDGKNIVEDFVFNYYEYIDKEIIDNGFVIPQKKFIEQVEYGKMTELYQTLYLLIAEKKW